MAGRLLSFWDGLFSGFSPETSKKNMVYNVHGPYKYIYIYVYIYIRMYLYMYIYIYTYTHITFIDIINSVFFQQKNNSYIVTCILWFKKKAASPVFRVSVIHLPETGRVAWGVYQAFLLARVPRRSGYPRRWPGGRFWESGRYQKWPKILEP